MAPTEDTIEVNCSGEINNFQADLIVDFFGNQSLASDQEIDILEQAFQNTYNDLNTLSNTGTCDLYFRQITSVTFSRADEITRRSRRSLRRDVPGLNVNQGFSPFFSYYARASGKCRGCPGNTQLFNDAGRRRELQNVKERLLQGSFVLLDTSPADDQCFCPVQVEEYRAPTMEEFLTAFNHTVQSLKAGQQIDFVESVTEVIELEEVDCSADTVIFTAEVYINLTVNNSANWTSQDVQELEYAIVESYNDLADNRCDPKFRTLLNATIIDYDTITPSLRRCRQLMAQRPVSFRYTKYKVTGSCKGCATGSNLNGNDARRMLAFDLEEAWMRIPHRHLLQNDTCYCDANYVSTHPPTESEFANKFEETIQELGVSTILNVTSVSSTPILVPSVVTPAPSTNVTLWGQIFDSNKTTSLRLFNNQLTGPVPSELGLLTQLTDLYLSSNSLTGPVPSEMGLLKQLTSLNIVNNQLTGPVPLEMGLLTQLAVLSLYNNQLTGPVPSEMGLLAQLTDLDLSSNSLTGHVPSELGLLTQLAVLSLYNNQLTGPVPSELGLLAQLTDLDLSSNSLTGHVPSELGLLTQLAVLSLYNNQLTGPVPLEMGLLKQLTYLNIFNNQLTGPVPLELGLLTQLLFLGLQQNGLTGPVPLEMGLLTQLSALYLSYNSLTGPMPSEWGLLTRLTDLSLSYNQLTGLVPSELGLLAQLTDLDLNDNQLTGPVPLELGLLTQLAVLSLDNNQLTGSIPLSLCSRASIFIDCGEISCSCCRSGSSSSSCN
jgi:Leucine-rich repeat (LRR) protein